MGKRKPPEDRENPPPRPKKNVTRKDIKAALANTNLAEPATPGGEPPKRADEPPMVSVIRLTLDDVEPFDHNPRTRANENYLNIRESIRARGLDSTMWVTRRPGEKKHVLAKGGGTRYAALRDLWEQTGERRFYELDFNLSEYRGEADLLAAHLSENINRADMCFWDRARGIISLKDEIEQQEGGLTYKDTVEKFQALGLPEVSRSLLALYQFATDRLHALGEAVYGLSIPAVRDLLQPGYNAYLRLADKGQYAGFDQNVWVPVLQEFGGSADPHPDWPQLIGMLDEVFAEQLHLPATTLRQMMQTLKHEPESTWNQLLPPASPPADPGEGDSAAAPATPGQAGGSGQRLRLQPVALPGVAGAAAARIAPEDGDRPPQALVEQVEAEQRLRAAEARAAATAATAPLAQAGDASLSARRHRRAEAAASVEQSKQALLSFATHLAARSKTLEGLILPREELVMGWMAELPAEVLAGTPLPPQAKQIFWFLVRASFQLHTGVHRPERLAGTRFGEFLQQASPAADQWQLIQPEGGFDFLMSWLIDPEYAALGGPAMRILGITRDLVANHPEQFLELGAALDFQDLQEAHQTQRLQAETEALDYYTQNGASPGMVQRLFPHADLSEIRFRPGRVAEIDLRTAQRLYDLWEDLCQEIASDRQRYIRLHQVFPDVSMASLYSAINDLG